MTAQPATSDVRTRRKALRRHKASLAHHPPRQAQPEKASLSPMLIGYARVSTHEQSANLQEDALRKVGCEKIFSDTASGTKDARPKLDEALSYLRKGDILVVWRLDRLGRSLKHLIETVQGLEDRKVGFRSLTESIDTTTSGGKLIFHIFAALAEFEHNLIRERTKAGLQSARARGRLGGRPPVMDAAKIAIAKSLKADPRTSISSICQSLNISKATFYRYTKEP